MHLPEDYNSGLVLSKHPISMPYRQIILNFSIEYFPFVAIQMENFMSGSIKLVFVIGKFTGIPGKHLESENEDIIKCLADLPGFKITPQKNIEFIFNINCNHDLKPIFFQIFTRLEKFNIEKNVRALFLRHLEYFSRDFIYKYPDKRPFTEVSEYSYRRQESPIYQQLEKCFDENSILNCIKLTTYTDGKIKLFIKSKSLLEFIYLKEAFSWDKWPDKSENDSASGLEFDFKLKNLTGYSIQSQLRAIFIELIRMKYSLVTTEIYLIFYNAMVDFFEAYNALLIKHQCINYNGSISEDINPGSPRKLPLNPFEELFNAIHLNYPNKKRTLLAMLTNGSSPDSLHNDMTLFRTLITNANNKEDIEGVKLLLEYNVNVDHKLRPSDKTVEDNILDELIFDLHPKSKPRIEKPTPRIIQLQKEKELKHQARMNVYHEILAILRCTRRAMPRPGFVHPKYKDSLVGQIVEMSNYLIRNHVSKEIGISRVGRLNSNLLIDTEDRKQFEVESLTGIKDESLRSLLQRECGETESKKIVKNLYDLFCSRFGKFEDGLAYFNKEILDSKLGQPGIEIIRSKIDGIICGFHVSKIIETDTDGKVLEREGRLVKVCYNVLSVVTKEFSNYNRAMTLIAIIRGFALQDRYPKAIVATIAEAASSYSLLQSRFIESYPKYRTVENIVHIANQAIYMKSEKAKPDEENGLYYINDDLAIKEKESNKLFLEELYQCYKEIKSHRQKNKPITYFFKPLQNRVSKEIYDGLMRDKKAILTGFFNAPENLQKLSIVIGENISDKSFSLRGIIHPQAQTLAPTAKL